MPTALRRQKQLAAQTLSFVSKLPPHFVTTTVNDILPPPLDVNVLSKDQLVAYLKTRDELTALVSGDPARFFKPSGDGQRGFLTDDKSRVAGFFAGNKGGKSTCGAIKFLERLMGKALWDRENRGYVAYPVPTRAAVFAEDFDSHKETTIPTLLTWLPKGEMLSYQRNPVGHVVEIKLRCGSLIHFRTYDQGSERAEGKDWSIVWCDEPPPRSIYTAIFRGIVALDGKMLITATLLKESWLSDEAEHDFFTIHEGTIHDNRWLSAEAVNDFVSTLDEDEKQVRETGKPASLVGVIYKEFRPDTPFIVPQTLALEYGEAGYPIIMGVDPHERRPCYCMFGYIDPDDRILWFHYFFAGGGTDKVFDKVNAEVNALPQRPCVVIMDPNRGGQIQKNGTSWAQDFEGEGYYVQMGSDDIHTGHSRMHSYFFCDLGSPIPRMRFTENCRGKGGPIWQLTRYSWEDWASRRIEKDAKEKPKDKNKDFPDICRYAAVAELEFDVLRAGYNILDNAPKDWRRPTGVRAYA